MYKVNCQSPFIILNYGENQFIVSSQRKTDSKAVHVFALREFLKQEKRKELGTEESL